MTSRSLARLLLILLVCPPATGAQTIRTDQTAAYYPWIQSTTW
jgi:hypothetical protein